MRQYEKYYSVIFCCWRSKPVPCPAPSSARGAGKHGFTLVELSIVLVIIGLIVGGVLTGRDLIKAAEIRAQISQIEKYQTAVNTFKLKYGYLPGDIPDPTASAFGFAARGTLPGEGNGDGIIGGYCCGGEAGWVMFGEPLMFWVDLSKAGLIEGSFTTATATAWAGDVSGAGVDAYYPRAKIGSGIHVYTLNLYNQQGFSSNPQYNHNNFFSISQVQTLGLVPASTATNVQNYGTAGIAVKQAYNIDVKIDDGLPVSGNVNTIGGLGTGGFYGEPYFSNGDVNAARSTATPGGSGITATATTCYDNGNNAANPVVYSMSQNSGGGLNCALSFKFQ